MSISGIWIAKDNKGLIVEQSGEDGQSYLSVRPQAVGEDMGKLVGVPIEVGKAGEKGDNRHILKSILRDYHHIPHFDFLGDYM